MTDFPTVGLKVDLSAIEDAETRLGRTERAIDAVAEAADRLANKTIAANRKVKDSNAQASSSEAARAQATARSAAAMARVAAVTTRMQAARVSSDIRFWAQVERAEAGYFNRSFDSNNRFWAQVERGEATHFNRQFDTNKSFFARRQRAQADADNRLVDTENTFWARRQRQEADGANKVFDADLAFFAKRQRAQADSDNREVDSHAKFWATYQRTEAAGLNRTFDLNASFHARRLRAEADADNKLFDADQKFWAMHERMEADYLNRQFDKQKAAAARAAKTTPGGGGATPPIVNPADITLLGRFGQALGTLRSGLSETRRLLFDVRTAVGVFLGAMVIRPLIDAADAMTALKARTAAFVNSGSDVPYMMEAIYRTAQATRTPLEAIATLYTRLAPLAKQLGRSQLDMLKITETVAKGIQIGGATPEEAKASSQQLAQALASNRLGGDELRSLAENAPLLLGQIAKALNMNTGQFIKWAHEGKATTEIVVGAIEKASKEIDRMFAAFPVTIGQATTMVANSFQNMVGRINDATGTSQAIAGLIAQFSGFLDSERTINALIAAINGLSSALHFLGGAMKVVIDYLPALLSIAGAVAGTMALNAAITLLTRTFATAGVAYALAGRQMTALAVAQGVAATGAAGFMAVAGRLFALIGGPWGAALIALTFGWNAVHNAQKAVATSADGLHKTQDGATGALERAAAFAKAYELNTNGLADAMLGAAGATKVGTDANSDALKMAQARAEAERQLTVEVLRRAAADATGRAEASDKAANGWLTGPKSFFQDVVRPGMAASGAAAAGLDPVKAANDIHTANQAAYDKLKKDAADGKKIAGDLNRTADEFAKAHLKITIPDARGVADPPGPTKPKKERGDGLEGARDNVGKLQAKLDGLMAQFQNMRANDPFSTWAAEIQEAGDQAAAALETGKKQNADLAEKTRRLAEQVKQQELLNAVQRISIDNIGKANDAAADSAAQSGAQLRSAEIMHAYAGRATVDQGDYLKALKASRDEITRQEIAESDLTIARRYGVASLDQIKDKILEVETARGTDYDTALANAQIASDAANAEAKAEANRIGVIRQGNDALSEREDVLAGVADMAARYSEQLDRMEDRTKMFADSISGAFGGAGDAIGSILGVMDNYIRKQAEVQAQQDRTIADPTDENFSKLIADQEALRQAQLKSYGDMLGAAKGFFKEGSKGYSTLQKAEQAYRLFEFAMSAKSVVVKTIETAAKVGLFGAQAQAAAATGAANMFATLGPLGFAAVAAMVAVLAGFGISGISGGGGAPTVPVSETRQKAQGAGSVLGDVTAKSDSISKALDIIGSNTNHELGYSNDMVKSLKSIDSHIGDLTATLARQLTTSTGAFSTDQFGLGSTSSKGGLAGALKGFMLGLGGLPGLIIGLVGAFMKTKVTTSLTDQGIHFNDQTVSGLVNGGVDGQTYQDIQIQKKKSIFGIGVSTKTSNQTFTNPLDDQLSRQIQLIVGDLSDSVIKAAGMIGVKNADANVGNMPTGLGDISFKDMTGDEVQEALNGVFSKLGDDMATTAAPFIGALQKVGEGALQTLVRIANDYAVLDDSLNSIGKTFGAIGVDSIPARENLIDLLGGIDQLKDKTAFFAQNFLSAAEQIAPVQQKVTTELARLGATGVTTREAFKNLVLAQDLTTESGQNMYAALLELAPAFDQVITYSDSLTQSVNDNAKTLGVWQTAYQNALDRENDARSDLITAYNAESSALQGVIDKFQKWADALLDFDNQLTTTDLGAGSGASQYATAQALFRANAAATLTPGDGQDDAFNKQVEISKSFLDVSKDNAKTALDYARDVAAVRISTAASRGYALEQVDVATQQLKELQDSVKGLIDINTSVLTVRDAIVNLTAAILAADKAGSVMDPQWGAVKNASTNQQLASTLGYTGTFGTGGFQAWIIQQNDDVKNIARQMLTDAGQPERIAFARGGAFQHGVISQPTAFDTGLMGERGPEGILPLEMDSNGRLGVRSTGSNDNGTGAVVAAMENQRQEQQVENVSIAMTLSSIDKRLDRIERDGIWARGVTPDDPVATKEEEAA